MRYFLVFYRFHTFFEILPTVCAFTNNAGFGEKCAVFMQSPLTYWAFYAVAFVSCYVVIFLLFFTAVTVITYVRFTGVRIVNLSMKLLFLLLTFCFSFWMNGELVRTSPGRLLVTLDGSEFDNFFGGNIFMRILVGISFSETWTGADGWTDAGVKP